MSNNFEDERNRLCGDEPAMAEFKDDDPLEVRIWAWEAERDRAVSREKSAEGKAKAQAFYDTIIANLKKRGHVCTYKHEDNFTCPVCGDVF